MLTLVLGFLLITTISHSFFLLWMSFSVLKLGHSDNTWWKKKRVLCTATHLASWHLAESPKCVCCVDHKLDQMKLMIPMTTLVTMTLKHLQSIIFPCPSCSIFFNHHRCFRKNWSNAIDKLQYWAYLMNHFFAMRGCSEMHFANNTNVQQLLLLRAFHTNSW